MGSNMHSTLDLKHIDQRSEDLYKLTWDLFLKGKHRKAFRVLKKLRRRQSDLGPFREAAMKIWVSCSCYSDMIDFPYIAAQTLDLYKDMYKGQDSAPTKRQLHNQRLLRELCWEIFHKLFDMGNKSPHPGKKEIRELLEPWLNAIAVMEDRQDSVMMHDLDEPMEPAQDPVSQTSQSSPVLS